MRTNIGAPDLISQLAERGERVVGSVDPHASTRGREQERVAHGGEEILGEPARLVTGVELLAQRDQRAGDVFVGHRPQDREPAVEGAPAEQRADALDVDGAVGDGLVEERQRVAHRPAHRRGR